MIINMALVDWLTVTTYDPDQYGHWLRMYGRDDGRPERVMQYSGSMSDKVFVGRGRQRGRPHFMLRASGERAAVVASQWDEWEVTGAQVKVTRVDYQCTFAMPAGWDWERLYKCARDWQAPGRARAVSRVDSSTGHTVYIGSRTSPYMIRVYQKSDEGGSRYVRVELEVKGEAAMSEWARYKGSSGSVVMALMREALSLPPCYEVDEIIQALPVVGYEPRPRHVRPEDSRTLAWLRNSVTPALMRTLRDHDHGHQAGDLIASWYAEAIKILAKP